MAPEFLQQLQAYLQARPSVPFQTWLANQNTPAPAPATPATQATPVAQKPIATSTPTPAPTPAPTRPRGLDSLFEAMMPPAYFSMMQSSPKMQGMMANFKDKLNTGFAERLRESTGKDTPPKFSGIAALSSGRTATPAPGMSMPPPGYRYGVDPEWNYGFKSMVKYEKPVDDTAKKKATGGTISTGNAKADAAIAAGDKKVIANQEAAARYAAMDNARDGTPIPAHLQQRLDNQAGGGGDVRRAEDRAALPSQYTGFWDRINGGGPGAGYKNAFDMINGGGMGGSYANPGTNIRGLGAVVNDLQQGGISALARDLVNGNGLGSSGENFRGGKRAALLNILGVNPAGEKKSIFNFIPEASPELEAQWAANQRYGWKPEKEKGKFSINNLFGTGGTKGTDGTDKKAEGGIMDIPAAAPPAQPPMGNEKELISSTIAAIKGQVEDPRPILGAFLAKYGEEALRNLVDKVESGDVDQTAARSGGMLKGPGDGMDDRIPAKVENGHDVLLANNEYIVPADVVSALGNGSSDAGAEHMDKMLERVRTAAHGKATQQKKVSADKVLPA